MFGENLLVEDNGACYKDKNTACQKLHKVFAWYTKVIPLHPRH